MSKRTAGSRTGAEAPAPHVEAKAAEPLPGDWFYLVDKGGSISAMREDGKVVQLKGTELKRVRRWVAERAK